MSSNAPQTRGSFARRMAGFTLLPVLAAVSPLAVLPVVSRAAGSDGWASALAGESLGTFAAIAIAFGWTSIGPAWIATADDDTKRGVIYRDSLVLRIVLAVIVLPLLAVICAVVATPGFELLAILMGTQGALIALSFSWFAVGVGSPGSIAYFDAIPRLVAAVLAAIAIASGAPLEVYPLAGIAVTVIGTALYSRRALRRYPGPWPSLRAVPALMRRGGHVAANESALGLYSAIPVPLVNLIAPGLAAAGFATADKMGKLGQFLPLSLANALQAWTGEVRGEERRHRVKLAVVAHTAMGLLGWAGLGVLGSVVSLFLFGPDAQAPTAILVVLGSAFAAFSIRASLSRHLLFPAGLSRVVLRATLIGSAVGVPLMFLLGMAAGWGPLGVAGGFAAIEVIATVLLVRPCLRVYRGITAEPS